MPETATPKPAHEVHHPATVGSTFMRQYYHFLAKEPASLHRFYKEESIWCHGVGSHMQEAISGQKAINDEILRRGYAGARVDLDIGSIDCQASLNGGVFVLVTGVMTLASSPVPKPFVQTFFLAVQPKGYFVLNDCLRFLELPGASPASLVAAAPSASDVAVAPKDTKKQPTQAAIGTPVAASPAAKAKPVTPVAAVKKEKVPASPAKKVETPVSPIKVKSPAKVASPKASLAPTPAPVAAPASPVKKTAPVVDKSAPKPSETKPATPASPVAAPAKPAATPASPARAKTAAPAKPAPADPVVPAAPAAPAAPKTWAALFSAAPAAPAAPATPAPKSAPAAKPTPASPAPAAAAAPAKAVETPAAPQEKKEEKEKEKKRYFSLYIRDMPPQAKDTDLRELFKSYGAIANVTVPQGRGFAFVDFFEQESMRAALADEKEFKLFDKVLHVDERTERKDKDRGFRSDRGGRGGRGPKGGRTGDRKEREDGKERREVNGKAPTSANGPHNNGDRREKGGRRSGKEEGGRGNKD